MRKPIQDELTHLALSRQRKYQLRMKRDGRCAVCGKPAAAGSRARCLKHLVQARERARRKAFAPHRRDAYGRELPPRLNGEESAASPVKSWPVRFGYQGDGVEVTAAMSGHGEIAEYSLAPLLQTFLTTLTWMCATSCSPADGRLTLTLSEKQSQWQLARTAGDSSSLRLILLGGQVPAALHGAAGCLGKRNGLPRPQLALEASRKRGKSGIGSEPVGH